jgi:hypothetical protein
LDLLAATRGHASASRQDAEDEVLRHLRDERLSVSGREGGQGPREIIPPLQLLDAEIDFDKDRIIAKDRWCGDLLFESAAALRIWQSEPEQRTTTPPSPVSSSFVNESQQSLLVPRATRALRPSLREMLEKYTEKYEDEPELPDAPVLKERHDQLYKEFGFKPRHNGEAQFVMLVARARLLRTGKISETDTEKAWHREVLRVLGQTEPVRGYSYDRFEKALKQIRRSAKFG